MKKANISKIKAELSKYLNFVKKGEEVIILDRDRAVAKIVGIPVEDQLRIRDPSVSLKVALSQLPARTYSETIDILDILDEEREDRA